jgi:hypothetical protein
MPRKPANAFCNSTISSGKVQLFIGPAQRE